MKSLKLKLQKLWQRWRGHHYTFVSPDNKLEVTVHAHSESVAWHLLKSRIIEKMYGGFALVYDEVAVDVVIRSFHLANTEAVYKIPG